MMDLEYGNLYETTTLLHCHAPIGVRHLLAAPHSEPHGQLFFTWLHNLFIACRR